MFHDYVVLSMLVLWTSVASSAACTAGNLDLTVLSPALLPIDQLYNSQTTSHYWYVMVCNPVKDYDYPKCPDLCAPGFVTEYSGKDKVSDSCEAVWDKSVTYVVVGDTVVANFGMLSQNPKNPKWTMQVILHCGSTPELLPMPGVVVKAVDLDDGGIGFTMQLQSSRVCNVRPAAPSGPDDSSSTGGCTGGCVFVILFFVSLVLYAAGMVSWNFFRQGKRGVDLVPHKEFWLSVPGLIKDGVVFSFSRVRQLCGGGQGGSSNSYSSVR